MSWSLEPSGRRLRYLDFDIETRLVGFHYAGPGKPQGSEPTALATQWVDEGQKEPFVWAVPEDDIVDLLAAFRELYDAADVVTGHYIRKFDLPLLNGAMLEHGFPMLTPKLALDTKTDLKTFEGLSKSQENLAGMLELAEDKHHMSDYLWRKATRLTPDGIAEAKTRVGGDVTQHIALRKALAEAGALNAPSLWIP